MKYKYELKIIFESNKPITKLDEKLGIQYENGLAYFVKSSTINESFIYGSGKRFLKLLRKTK
jgi:hypothetical protein